MLEKIKARGIPEERIETIKYSGVDFDQWFKSFDSVEASVKDSVDVIKHHPLFPENVPVHGLVIDPKTGKLDLIVNGYNN